MEGGINKKTGGREEEQKLFFHLYNILQEKSEIDLKGDNFKCWDFCLRQISLSLNRA